MVDYYAVSGANVQELAQVITDRGYRYGKHWLPHDAKAKTLTSGGKSIIEQLGAQRALQGLFLQRGRTGRKHPGGRCEVVGLDAHVGCILG